MPPAKRGRKKHKKSAAGSKKKAPVQDEVLVKEGSRCRLLEMPPELRNRIYDFTKEEEYQSYNPAPLLTKIKPAMKGRLQYSRKFFALTQACKQLRSEFRPLWLRGSFIHLKFDDINSFIATFYPLLADYENAPKLLTISWDHFYDEVDSDIDNILFDLTPLLRLRAFRPTCVISFVPRRITDYDYPNLDCADCGHSIHCDCDDGSGCEHEDARDEAQGILNDIYVYTDVLDEIVGSYNEAWLKTIRETSYSKSIKVEATVVSTAMNIVIYIRFNAGVAPAYFKKKTMYHDAVRFLHSKGMLRLTYGSAITFFVGGTTGKYTRHSQHCRVATPMYDQVEIHGETVYKPETAADQKASSTGLRD